MGETFNMSKQETASYAARESKIIESENYLSQDIEEFHRLLSQKEVNSGPGSVNSLTPGQILTGTIVEITKDFVVVDVGLKSEGLIPIAEFGAPKEIELGVDVEVYLEESEGDQGQIILSREKARKLRRWEHIVGNFKEGSIIEGSISRKVKGGLMVDIGGSMDAFLPGSQVDNKRIKSLDDYVGKTFELNTVQVGGVGGGPVFDFSRILTRS